MNKVEIRLNGDTSEQAVEEFIDEVARDENISKENLISVYSYDIDHNPQDLISVTTEVDKNTNNYKPLVYVENTNNYKALVYAEQHNKTDFVNGATLYYKHVEKCIAIASPKITFIHGKLITKLYKNIEQINVKHLKSFNDKNKAYQHYEILKDCGFDVEWIEK